MFPKPGTCSLSSLTFTPETTLMLSKWARPLNFGNPGVSPFRTRRKKCLYASSSRRSVLRWIAADTRGGFGIVAPALDQRLALVEMRPALSGLPVAVDALLQRGIVELPLVLERPLEPVPGAPPLREQTADDLPVRGDGGHAVVPPIWAWTRALVVPRNAP